MESEDEQDAEYDVAANSDYEEEATIKDTYVDSDDDAPARSKAQKSYSKPSAPSRSSSKAKPNHIVLSGGDVYVDDDADIYEGSASSSSKRTSKGSVMDSQQEVASSASKKRVLPPSFAQGKGLTGIAKKGVLPVWE